MIPISVVIPAYNHEAFIAQAIRSVLDQTCADFELIVIDDGSTDGTWDVIQTLRDKRIRALRQENQDAYNTLNRGFHLAGGRYIAVLNSDDFYPPDRLAVLLAEQTRSGGECLFSDVQPVDAAGRPILDPVHPWHQWHARNRAFYFECGDLYTGFLRGNFMVTTSNLFLTAAAARRVGDFAPYRYLHDYDFIFRVMLACPGRVRYLHRRKLLYYRLHGGSTLGRGAVTAREQDQEIIRNYLLQGVAESERVRVAAGADRLLELERELAVERTRLARAPSRWGRLLRALPARLWGRMARGC